MKRSRKRTAAQLESMSQLKHQGVLSLASTVRILALLLKETTERVNDLEDNLSELETGLTKLRKRGDNAN